MEYEGKSSLESQKVGDTPQQSFIDKFKSLPQMTQYIIFGAAGVVLLTIIIVIIAVAASGGDKKKDDPSPDPKPDPEPIPDDLEAAWKLYLKAKKSIFTWEYFHSTFLLNMIKDHGFTEIHLNIGCINDKWEKAFSKGEFPTMGDIKLGEMVDKLKELNVQVTLVTYLNGDPNKFTYMEERVPIVVNMVKEFAASHSNVVGLQFDQEASKGTALQNLLQMLEMSNKIYDKTSCCIKPLYVRQKMADIADCFDNSTFYDQVKGYDTYLDAIFHLCKGGDLMAYQNDYPLVESLIDKALNISKNYSDKRMNFIIEMTWEGVEDTDHLHNKFLEDKKTFFTNYYNWSLKYGPICIHQFVSWYWNLFCDELDPDKGDSSYTYYFGLPKECSYKR